MSRSMTRWHDEEGEFCFVVIDALVYVYTFEWD